MAKKVLIIEDDANIADVLCMRFAAEGYAASIARNGKEGWEKVKAEKPDVVILDIELPLASGYEVCSAIKETKATQHIPVIMLTAKEKMNDMEKGFTSGANAYICKPYIWERLLLKVRQYLK